MWLGVGVARVLFLAIVFPLTVIAADDPLSPFREDRERLVRSFPSEFVSRVVSPSKKEEGVMVQYPVVSRGPIRQILRSLDPNQDAAAQMEMRYGLNEVTNSYYRDEPHTYVEMHGLRVGTAPNCFTCHSSRLQTDIIFGLGNNRIDLREFFHDLLPNTAPVAMLRSLPAFLNVSPIFLELLAIDPQIQAYLAELGVDLGSIWEWESIGATNFVKPASSARSFSLFSGFQNAYRAYNRLMMLLDMYDFVRSPESQSPVAGHSDPWSFALQLFKWRDNNMDYLDDSSNGRDFRWQSVVLDPMPWWTLKYKRSINWDGIIAKSPRAAVQAALAPGKNGEEIQASESLFVEIYNNIHKLDAPKYPAVAPLDLEKARRGEIVFSQSCAKCHGQYSSEGRYFRDPEEFRKNYREPIIPLRVIGTDPRRLDTVNLDYLRQLEQSWIGFYGSNTQYIRSVRHQWADRREGEGEFAFRYENYLDPEKRGYIAPPLWGIWASAPYLHNGSVPTLRALLFPEERPKRWRLKTSERAESPYDFERTGLDVDYDPPADPKSTKIYDTSMPGQSSAGHEKQFLKLSVDERLFLIEYLKTL